MKLEENIIVVSGCRIFELVWRGFYFREKKTFKKANNKRFKEHSEKCFYNAHRLFRKHNKMQNLGWKNWEISIVRPCQNISFFSKSCAFKITRIK
jgi:hypothetical protein